MGIFCVLLEKELDPAAAAAVRKENLQQDPCKNYANCGACERAENLALVSADVDPGGFDIAAARD